MYSLSVILTLSLASMIIGALIGLYIAKNKGGFTQRQSELEQQLTDIKKQQQDYQHEVTAHFSQTAQLLNQLTDSYRDVHQHLAEGAHLLADASTSAAIKQLNTPVETDTDTSHPLTPPLDYAPSTGKGVLSEEFGVEKPTTVSEKRSPLGYPEA